MTCERRFVLATLTGLAMMGTILRTTQAESPNPKIRPGHNLLEERDSTLQLKIGDRLQDFGFYDLAHQTHHVCDLVKQGPTAFVFLSTKCPLAKRYTERLKQMHSAYASQGVTIVGVYPNSDETQQGVEEFVAAAGFEFPIVLDRDGYLARRLGATMTPQVFLLDQHATLAYRGAIDDNRYENRVRDRYLLTAIDALTGGGTVAVASTKSLGCSVHLADPCEIETVTYSDHIARILQDNCQSCHREGQVGPFSLTTFEEAHQWREEIQAYTHKRLMPPWKAAPGFGEFANDISLSDDEIELIARWVEQEAPEGDPQQVPPNPRYQEGWAFGEPDLILEMPEEYVVGPEGEDDYRHFVIPYEFGEDRYVEAVDVRPGNRNTVHHVLVYVDTSGKARELDAEAPGPGYSRFGGVGFEPVASLGGWAPGNAANKKPPNTGAWLPKKSDIVMQVHYYRTGIEERDRTRVGLYFSKAPRPVKARGGMVINTEFELTPGESDCEVRGSQVIEHPVYLYSVTPHMHLLGRSMEVTAQLPGGEVIPLIRIDDWDFNWQTTYHFRELKFLPAGTRVEMAASFDNSAANPHNPNDPPKPVHWGERTTDEMCICFLGLLSAAEYDHTTLDRRIAPSPAPTSP